MPPRSDSPRPPVLVPGQRLRLSRHHDRQPRLGARLPRDGADAARVLRGRDPGAARHRLLPRPTAEHEARRRRLPMIRPVADASPATRARSAGLPLPARRRPRERRGRAGGSATRSLGHRHRPRARKPFAAAVTGIDGAAPFLSPTPCASASSRCAATTKCWPARPRALDRVPEAHAVARLRRPPRLRPRRRHGRARLRRPRHRRRLRVDDRARPVARRADPRAVALARDLGASPS